MADMKLLASVIDNYSNQVKEYLLGKNFYGENAATLGIKYLKKYPTPPVPPNQFEKLNIVDSINDVIKYSLSRSPKHGIDRKFRDGDVFVFGDVHGQLDLLIQNLYIAGLIDKEGNLINSARKKTIVQVGDTINRGPFSWETMIYLNFLQQQAMGNGNKVVRIVGNHEYHLISNEQTEYAKNLLKEVVKSDILEKRLVLSHTDKDKRVMFFHGGMQKKPLVKSILGYLKESGDPNKSQIKQKYEDILKNLKIKNSLNLDSYEGKNIYKKIKKETSSQKIYKLMDISNISLKDISNWMSRQLVNQVKNDDYSFVSDTAHLFSSKDSILETYYKSICKRHPERFQQGRKAFIIKRSEGKYKWKPLQVTGHNPSEYVISKCGEDGGIKQNKANVFTDVGLVREMGAYQGYVIINKRLNKAFAVEMHGSKDPAKLFDDSNKPFGIECKIPYFRCRQLEGIVLHDNYLKKDNKKEQIELIKEKLLGQKSGSLKKISIKL